MALVLLLSGVLSVLGLTTLGKQMRAILDAGYQSVECSERLLSTLDNQNRALLTAIAADEATRREQQEYFDSFGVSFLHHIALARSSATSDNASAYLDTVANSYTLYRERAGRLFEGDTYDLGYFTSSVLPLVARLKADINQLRSYNEAELYNAVPYLEEHPHRVLRPGLMVMIVGALYVLMLAFFIRHYYIVPLRRIRLSVVHYLRFRRYKSVPIETHDELLDMREAVDELVMAAMGEENSSLEKTVQ